ncbi:MAG: PorT family protein [Paramuribaculum sp.]|nr:PorT family protein [Paramuribaculum sp.]
MKRLSGLFLLLGLLLMTAVTVVAQPNSKLENKPYADLRRWHLGFSVGVQTLDFRFINNGYITSDGRSWFMEQPSFSPGFNVTGLVDLRLSKYFNLRCSPGMYFGNRDVKFIDVKSGQTESQNIKSTYVVLPFDLKFSAQRYRNCRPYIVGGVMPAFDVAKKRSDFLMLNGFDMFLTIGFGCDFYLPFFKLNPEIKFCFGLVDVLKHDRPDLADDPLRLDVTRSVSKVTSQMFVLSFYFE